MYFSLVELSIINFEVRCLRTILCRYGLLALLFLLSWGCATKSSDRLALIVGNAAYSHSQNLKNPAHDAAALSRAFDDLGFTVIHSQDLSKSAMQSTLKEFYQKLEGAQVGVFYYGGHGLQLNNKNFLVPVEFDPNVEDYLEDQLVLLDGILNQMAGRTPVNLVFLDACRDNPFSNSLKARLTNGRSVAINEQRGIRVVAKGLAEMKGNVGTLIAYATQPGNVALDGEGNNSPFAHGLLSHLNTPGLEIRELLMKVRGSVVDETDGAQIPWDHSSLLERFYFKKKGKRAPPPP